jgi:hypothetical protein
MTRSAAEASARYAGLSLTHAAHPDRDDYFTIGTIAELIGMSEVHSTACRYSLTQADQAPWRHYDVIAVLRQWLTAPRGKIARKAWIPFSRNWMACSA